VDIRLFFFMVFSMARLCAKPKKLGTVKPKHRPKKPSLRNNQDSPEWVQKYECLVGLVFEPFFWLKIRHRLTLSDRQRFSKNAVVRASSTA
jgi:hypothetical protein